MKCTTLLAFNSFILIFFYYLNFLSFWWFLLVGLPLGQIPFIFFWNHKKGLRVFMKMYFWVFSDFTINIFISLLSMKHNYKLSIIVELSRSRCGSKLTITKMSHSFKFLADSMFLNNTLTPYKVYTLWHQFD